MEADYTAADVVCANGYKWLRAGRGTGFAWFSERALERIAPVLSGFAGTDGDLPVDVVPPPAASAQAFTVAGADQLAASRLATALRDVRDVGVDVIEAELAERTRDVIYFADRYEVPVLTPREPERRAGIVTLAPAPQDAAPLAASLANHGLTVTVALRTACGSRRTSARAPTRCACSATRSRSSRRRACGDSLAPAPASGINPPVTRIQRVGGARRRRSDVRSSHRAERPVGSASRIATRDPLVDS